MAEAAWQQQATGMAAAYMRRILLWSHWPQHSPAGIGRTSHSAWLLSPFEAASKVSHRIGTLVETRVLPRPLGNGHTSPMALLSMSVGKII